MNAVEITQAQKRKKVRDRKARNRADKDAGLGWFEMYLPDMPVRLMLVTKGYILQRDVNDKAIAREALRDWIVDESKASSAAAVHRVARDTHSLVRRG